MATAEWQAYLDGYARERSTWGVLDHFAHWAVAVLVESAVRTPGADAADPGAPRAVRRKWLLTCCGTRPPTGRRPSSGTRGSFNWYRALDLNWEDARRIADPTIRVPTLVITADNDPILRPALAEPMPRWIPGLRTENIRRCSHWTKQERPDEVNRLLLEFIADLR